MRVQADDQALYVPPLHFSLTLKVVNKLNVRIQQGKYKGEKKL